MVVHSGNGKLWAFKSVELLGSYLLREHEFILHVVEKWLGWVLIKSKSIGMLVYIISSAGITFSEKGWRVSYPRLESLGTCESDILQPCSHVISNSKEVRDAQPCFHRGVLKTSYLRTRGTPLVKELVENVRRVFVLPFNQVLLLHGLHKTSVNT